MKYLSKYGLVICSLFFASQAWALSPKSRSGYFPLDRALSYQCFDSKISSLIIKEGGQLTKRGNLEGILGSELLEFDLPRKLGAINYGIELKLEVGRYEEKITDLRHNFREVSIITPSTLLARTDSNAKEVAAIEAELGRLEGQLYELAWSCYVQG